MDKLSLQTIITAIQTYIAVNGNIKLKKPLNTSQGVVVSLEVDYAKMSDDSWTEYELFSEKEITIFYHKILKSIFKQKMSLETPKISYEGITQVRTYSTFTNKFSPTSGYSWIEIDGKVITSWNIDL